MTDHASRDLAIRAMVSELGAKKLLLVKKATTLESTVNTNHLLQGVVKDYQTYRHKLIEEKHQQQSAMNVIVKHLETILKEETLNDTALEYAKQQQKDILTSLSKVKRNLDEILNV